MSDQQTQSDKLPPHWEKVHGAIWLIGLAILFYMGDIFPGILVLIALSSLVQVGISIYVKRNQESTALEIERELHLPPNCPNCGSPLDPTKVSWKGKQSAICPYCGSTIKATARAPHAAHEAP